MTDPALDAPPDASGGASMVNGGVTFRLADPHRRLHGVRLLQEVGLHGPLELVRAGGHWQLRLLIPAVDRMEYLFEITDHHGERVTITDPANPCRAGGAFGDKSVVEFPGYRRPEWLDQPGVEDTEAGLRVAAAPLGSEVTGVLWQPRSLPARQPAPLLVVHDGPEYATLGHFTKYLGTAIADGILPPLRAALLGPGDRNNWYAANPIYARTLARAVLPAIDGMVASTVRVGVGVSLGGLALLHAQRRFRRLFDALMLQSGSFFTPETDAQERSFSGYRRVTRFVHGVHASPSPARPIPIVLTCGTVEENLANNRAMAGTLGRLGYPVRMIEVRDAHNYTAWRDALHPHLTGLMSDVLDQHAA